MTALLDPGKIRDGTRYGRAPDPAHHAYAEWVLQDRRPQCLVEMSTKLLDVCNGDWKSDTVQHVCYQQGDGHPCCRDPTEVPRKMMRPSLG